ncbi:AAA family ATPase [Cellulomonas sp. zg-ZUI222]|uniref:AAA family ATPase n=1 Tax=Cellulomonas wangleii TaxID=2816956 RepID=UPI001A94B798|nr:AAA family ATPase [Cellulomonas wangleii]MBO0920361.1 AAA family ATPase [Cellulomonas wangleii]
MNLDIATAPRAAAATWKRGTVTWAEVCGWVTEPRDGGKDGPGFLLGRLSSPRRTKDTVVSRGVLALDADHLTMTTRGKLLARLRALGCAAVVYSTYGSTPSAPRLRVLVLAARAVEPDEYRVLVRWLMQQLGSDLFDPTCDQPERFMYMPTLPAQGEYFSEVVDGEPYDVDDALLRADLAQAAENASLAASPPVTPESISPAPFGPLAVPEDVVRGEIAWTLARLDSLAALAEGDRLDWPGQPEGVGWDTGTFLAAQRLVEAANSGTAYTLEDAESDFMAHAPASGGTYNRDHKWASAVKATGAQPLPHERAADVFGRVVDDAPTGRFTRLNLRELLDPNRPPRRYVVDLLLLEGTATAFIAPAGHRKSLVALSLAVAVARGDAEWAGLTIPRGRRVLYVDMENTEDDLRERLLSFGVTDDIERLVVLSMPPMRPLDTERGGDEFLAAVDAFGLEPGDLVVLDSYQRITEAGENDSDTTRAFYRHTGVGLKQRGLTVIRTDNTGKDAARGARGSSGKRDDVDVEYLIKSTGDLIEFTPGKARQRGVDGLTVRVHTTSDGHTSFSGSRGTAHQADVAGCIDWLDEHEVDPSTGHNKVSEMVRDGDRLLFTRAVVREAVRIRKERAEDFL